MKFAVIGDPVAHSRSPRMHAAAYAALGMQHTYEAIRVAGGDREALHEVLERLRRGELAGLNVTVPHKELVLDLVDRVSPLADGVRAANTLVRDARGQISAHNTDVPAIAEVVEELGARPGNALILGSGGTARAAAHAMHDLAGFGLRMRSRSRARWASATWDPLEPNRDDDKDVAVVIQATSCGMHGGPPGEIVSSAVAWDALPDDAVALDVVYPPEAHAGAPYRAAPLDTPFLAAARARGLRCANGLGMLARQGALAFELWLGVRPPLDVMLRAIGG